MAPPPPPVLTDPTERQISPQIAAVLLSTPRPDLTTPNAQIVDALKAGCPGYAVMRSLMMGFRAVLKQSPPATATWTPIRPVTALHQWMDRARASGIALIQHFESRLQRDILAVEAAVTDHWSKGAGRGTGQSFEDAQATNVRESRGGASPRPTDSAACRVQSLASGMSQSHGNESEPQSILDYCYYKQAAVAESHNPLSDEAGTVQCVRTLKSLTLDSHGGLMVRLQT